MRLLHPPQMGFGTLKSFYSTVATSVEGAAKSQGFNLQLGAANAATGSGHGAFNSNSNTKLYNDTAVSDNNGGGSIGYGRSAHVGDERSASGEGPVSYGSAGGSSGWSGSARQQGGRQPPAQRTRDNNAGFEGFGSADADGGELQHRASCRMEGLH